MNTEFFKNVSRILTKKVAEVSYLLSINSLNTKETSLLELIDHFQSLYYIYIQKVQSSEISDIFSSSPDLYNNRKVRNCQQTRKISSEFSRIPGGWQRVSSRKRSK